MVVLFNRRWTRAELLRHVGHISQLGGVQLLAAENGPPRGVRLLEFRTGTGFTFKVSVERGMDVGYCEYQGASLAWIPPTLLPGAWYCGQQEEFGWLRAGLGGFCNSCGMMHIGNPETDSVAHYNFPARPTERYGVHDRMALIPGELLSLGERWDGDDCVLEAVGRVAQAQTTARIWCSPGATRPAWANPDSSCTTRSRTPDLCPPSTCSSITSTSGSPSSTTAPSSWRPLPVRRGCSSGRRTRRDRRNMPGSLLRRRIGCSRRSSTRCWPTATTASPWGSSIPSLARAVR